MTQQTPAVRPFALPLATIAACSVANTYYLHPIIAVVGRDLGVDVASVGLIPAVNQFALALGILLLLPLGDIFDNRSLCTVFSALQCAALAAMAAAPDVVLFTVASSLLGFVTIVPYLLPSYASRRVPKSDLAAVTAYLGAGAIIGIFAARVAAGVLAEYVHWRVVYAVAAGVMALTTGLVRTRLVPGTPPPGTARPRYGALLISTARVFLGTPAAIRASLTQGCNFGLAISVWLGLALYLTSPAVGYGSDVLGYLSVLSLAGAFATPRITRFASRFGYRTTLSGLAALQIVSILPLVCAGHALAAIAVPMFLLCATFGPTDAINRVYILSEPPAIRSRLMTCYVMSMFLCAALSSWVVSGLFGAFGWAGVLGMGAGLSATVLLLSRKRGEPGLS